MRYSTVCFAAMSRSLTFEPTETTSLVIVLLRDHARVAEPLLERGDAVLEQRLLVLRVVVLRVLGDVAELARGLDPVGDLAALVVREVLDLLLELLVAFRSEDDFLQLGLLKEKRAAQGRRRGRGCYLRRRTDVNPSHGYYFPLCAGRSSQPLVDPGRRDPDAARARPDGGRERAGLPPPGPALRGRARLLGDGELRRAPARERAHARLPADRLGRAAAGGADLRLRARRDGRGGADGRGRGRRHRRHQLRLPGAGR